MTTAPSLTDPLAVTQAALAGEHACVYGYGVAGAHLADDAVGAAREALAVHRSRRDALAAQIRAAGGEPEAALAGYALPFAVTDDADARKLAAELERRLAGLYADLVAAAPDEPARELAVGGLVDIAVRLTSWSGETPALPGLDGRPGVPGSTPTPAPTTASPPPASP